MTPPLDYYTPLHRPSPRLPSSPRSLPSPTALRLATLLLLLVVSSPPFAHAAPPRGPPPAPPPRGAPTTLLPRGAPNAPLPPVRAPNAPVDQKALDRGSGPVEGRGVLDQPAETQEVLDGSVEEEANEDKEDRGENGTERGDDEDEGGEGEEEEDSSGVLVVEEDEPTAVEDTQASWLFDVEDFPDLSAGCVSSGRADPPGSPGEPSNFTVSLLYSYNSAGNCEAFLRLAWNLPEQGLQWLEGFTLTLLYNNFNQRCIKFRPKAQGPPWTANLSQTRFEYDYRFQSDLRWNGQTPTVLLASAPETNWNEAQCESCSIRLRTAQPSDCMPTLPPSPNPTSPGSWGPPVISMPGEDVAQGGAKRGPLTAAEKATIVLFASMGVVLGGVMVYAAVRRCRRPMNGAGGYGLIQSREVTEVQHLVPPNCPDCAECQMRRQCGLHPPRTASYTSPEEESDQRIKDAFRPPRPIEEDDVMTLCDSYASMNSSLADSREGINVHLSNPSRWWTLNSV